MKNKNTLNYVPASAKTAAQKKEDAKKGGPGRELTQAQRKKLRAKRIWTIAVASLSFVLVLTLSLVFATYTPILNSELSKNPPTETVVSSGGLIDNGEFDLSKYLYSGLTSSAMQYPYVPENWTLSNTVASQSVAGVISHDEKNRDKVKKDLKGMGLTDAQVTDVLNTEFEKDANTNALLIFNKTIAGVRAYSSSFTVPESGYLEITVKIRTVINADSDGAFIALKTTSSDTAEAELSFVGINTDGAWKEYTFYVEGSKTSGKTLYLFVGLGTADNPVQGFAEVDFAKAESTKKVTYMENSEATSDVVKTKSFVQNTAKEENLFDGNAPQLFAENGDAAPTETVDELPFYGDPTVYVVSNDGSSGKNSAYIKLTSDLLKLNQSTATPYYRFSFWAKTQDILNNTGAYFYATVLDANRKPMTNFTKSFELIKTPTASDDVNSGWAEFSFLLQPDTAQAYSVEVLFALGALRTDDGLTFSPAQSDFATTGKLFVTEFELKEIYPSEYNSASDSDTVRKVTASVTTVTGLVNNGHFDSLVANAYSDEDSVPTGYDPDGWQISVPKVKTENGYVYAPHADSDVLFGVVPKNSADKTKYLGANADEYFDHTGGTNILAVNVLKPTSIGFVSNKFTLTANSYYVISFMVKTTSDKVSARLTGDIQQSFDKLIGADSDFYLLDAYDINDGYKQFSFVVKTGDKDKSVAIELWVGKSAPQYKDNAWNTADFAAANTIVAFDEVKTQTINKSKFDEITSLKDGEKDLFVKTEIKQPVKDEDGNDTEQEEVADVTYATEKANLWLRDFSYVDKSDAIVSDDETTDQNNTQTAPINWLLLTSLILAVAVIIFLIAMLVKRFKANRKRRYVEEDPDYKK